MSQNWLFWSIKKQKFFEEFYLVWSRKSLSLEKTCQLRYNKLYLKPRKIKELGWERVFIWEK